MTHAPLIALMAALVATTAHGSKTLDDAQAAFDSLAVDDAAPLFEKALREPATREERIKAWKGLGMSLAFMAEPRKAQAAFEKLLLIDPNAKVDQSLGPRVSRPFDAARKAMRGKRAAFEVERKNRTGEVTAKLTDPLGFASELRIYWRVHGARAFEQVTSDADEVVVAKTPPDKDIEVYVQAYDKDQGVIFQDGTETAFASMGAVVRAAPEAVISAVKEAQKSSGRRDVEAEVTAPVEEEQSSSSSSWPLYLAGAAVVVGGGAAAAYFLSRPPELSLAPADKTGQLPWRF